MPFFFGLLKRSRKGILNEPIEESLDTRLLAREENKKLGNKPNCRLAWDEQYVCEHKARRCLEVAKNVFVCRVVGSGVAHAGFRPR